MSQRAEPRGIEREIQDAIDIHLLQGFGESKAKVNELSQAGATDAYTLRAKASVTFFAKVNLDPDQTRRERQGYARLRKVSSAPFLEHVVPPLISDPGSPLMLYPFLDRFRTFHDWVAKGGPAQPKVDLYKSMLSSLLEGLWVPTQRAESPEVKKQYSDRLHTRSRDLEKFLEKRFEISDYRDLRIAVNDADMWNLGDLLDQADGLVDRLKLNHSCTIHGDEHAKNLMVGPQKRWFIVDYSSVAPKSDWVYGVAKLLHWWRLYYSIALAKDDADLRRRLGCDYKARRIKDGSKRIPLLELKYDEAEHRSALTPTCETLAKTVLDFAKQAGRRLNDRSWDKRLGLAYFSVVFGSVVVPDHLARFRDVAAPMVHDAVRVFLEPECVNR